MERWGGVVIVVGGRREGEVLSGGTEESMDSGDVKVKDVKIIDQSKCEKNNKDLQCGEVVVKASQRTERSGPTLDSKSR